MLSNIFSYCDCFKSNSQIKNLSDSQLDYTYIVQRGQTIHSISLLFHTTEDEIIKSAGNSVETHYYIEPNGNRIEYKFIPPGTVLKISKKKKFEQVVNYEDSKL